MPKKRSVQKIEVSDFNLQVPITKFLRKKDLTKIGNLAAKGARRLIIERLDRGEYPLGGSRIYSTSELNLPTILPHRSGPVFNSVWPSFVNKMLAFAETQQSFEGQQNVYGALRWVNYPLGYRQFRRTIGLDDTKVNLQLTGQMINDMIVEADSSQTRAFIGARRLNGKFIKGKVGKGNKVIGKIKLQIGFNNPASEILAGYIENGRWPRRFVFFTDQENAIIADSFSSAVRAALSGQDPIGTFKKFGF